MPSRIYLYQFIGLIQITRPHNCFGAAMAALLGVYLVGGVEHMLKPLVMRASLVVWLIVAVSNVVNDLRDVAVDSLNKPRRPIPAGHVSRHVADILALVLISATLGVAGTLGLGLAAIAVISGTLGIGYSYYLKSTVLLGNGTVGFLSGITVTFGGLAAGSLTPSVSIAALLVFLFVFIREILKTIADQKSDALVGVCTVATHLGTAAALRIFQVFVAIFIVAAVTPWFLHLAPDRYLCAVVLGFILPTVGLVVLLTLKFTDDTVRLALRATKILWFSGLLTLALLK